MPARSAPAQSTARSPIARVLAASTRKVAANDDACPDLLPVAALRHFAMHGLGAACAARIEAERALDNEERDAAETWLGICVMFDRRGSADLEARFAGQFRATHSASGVI